MENQIKEARKAKKLSQEELEKACGISRQTINAIENNKYDSKPFISFSVSPAIRFNS